jgi:hypothetical protein
MRRILAISCSLLILFAIGCSRQESNQSSFTLAGKWHGEKRDLSRFIEKIRRQDPNLPAQLIDPLIEKMKRGAEMTDDWQFNSDGTGSHYYQTGAKPEPITWRLVRKRGATYFVELHMHPDDKSPVKIVFKGADRFAMVWLEQGESEDFPPETYHRVR